MTEILCRLCGEGIAGLPVPMVTDDCREKLASIIPELDAYDINSPMMCILCSNSLSDAYAFKQHCLHTNKTMRSLQQPKPIIPTMELDSFTIKLEDIDLSEIKHEDNEITCPKLVEQTWSCAYCDKTCQSLGVLTQHVRYIHLEDFRRQKEKKSQIVFQKDLKNKEDNVNKIDVKAKLTDSAFKKTNGIVTVSVKDNNIIEHEDCLNSRKFPCTLNLHANQILELRNLDSEPREFDSEHLENNYEVRIAQELRDLSQSATLESGNLDSESFEFDDDSLENYEVDTAQESGEFSQNRTLESVNLDSEPSEAGMDGVNSNCTDNHHTVTISEQLGGLNQNGTLGLKNLDSQPREFEDENFDCPENSNKASVLQNSVILPRNKTLECPNLDCKTYECDNCNLRVPNKTSKGSVTKELRSLGQNGTLESGNLVSKPSEFDSNNLDCLENRKMTRALLRSQILRKSKTLESQNSDSKIRELGDCNNGRMTKKLRSLGQTGIFESPQLDYKACGFNKGNSDCPENIKDTRAVRQSLILHTNGNVESGNLDSETSEFDDCNLGIPKINMTERIAQKLHSFNQNGTVESQNSDAEMISSTYKLETPRSLKQKSKLALPWDKVVFDKQLMQMLQEHETLTCKICEFQAISSKTLRLHLKEHMSYQCRYCDATFSKRMTVYWHVCKNHQDKYEYVENQLSRQIDSLADRNRKPGMAHLLECSTKVKGTEEPNNLQKSIDNNDKSDSLHSTITGGTDSQNLSNSDVPVVNFDDSQELDSRILLVKGKTVCKSGKKRGRPCKAREKNIEIPKFEWDKNQEPETTHNSFKKSTADNNKSGDCNLPILASDDSTLSASNMSMDNSESLLSIIRTEPVTPPSTSTRKIHRALRPSLYWDRRLFNTELNKLFKQHSGTTCLICRHVSPTMSILQSHLRVHINFQCNYCVRTFRTCNGVISHVKTAHKDVPAYPCPICGRLFANKLSRNEHKNRTHTKKNSSVCSVCRKRVSDVSMTRHMRSHAEPNKFECHLCSKGFLQAAALNNHQYKCSKK